MSSTIGSTDLMTETEWIEAWRLLERINTACGLIDDLVALCEGEGLGDRPEVENVFTEQKWRFPHGREQRELL